MTDIEESHKFWSKKEITSPVSHPKVVGFHSFFKKLRKKGTNPIFSLGEIELPSAVSEEVSIKRVGCHSGYSVTHHELIALENSDYLDQDKDDLDIM